MKNILIREVPVDIIKIVEDFKEEFKIKTNTDAVMTILRHFTEMRLDYRVTKEDLRNTQRELRHIKGNLERVRDLRYKLEVEMKFLDAHK